MSNGMHQKIIDEVSIEAMLSETGINWTNGHIIFRHLKQIFGKNLAVSKKKRRAYFGGNVPPPPLSVDWLVLEDKTIVSHRLKHPDKLLQLIKIANIQHSKDDIEVLKKKLCFKRWLRVCG